jgi:hypothetical protein
MTQVSYATINELLQIAIRASQKESETHIQRVPKSNRL